MIDETYGTELASRVFPYDPRYTPSEAPITGVFDAPLHQLCINAHWWAHVEGVIERLTWRDAWKGAPEEQQAAADQALEILAAIGQAISCGETSMFQLRQSPSNPCILEQTFDGGLNWTTAFNYALCSAGGGGLTFNTELGISVINNNTTIYNGDPDDFRPEITANDASTNAAICHALELTIRASIAGLIERKRDDYTQETIFIAVGGILATTTAFLFGGPIAGLGTAIGVAAGLIGNALIDGIDADDLQAVLANDGLLDSIVCCAYDVLFDTRPTPSTFETALDGCSLFGSAAAILPALQEIFEDFDVFIQFLDAAGMAHAYAEAGVLGNECDTICDTWCKTFDFTIDAQGWTVYPLGGVFNASYSAGVGWRPVNVVGGGYSHRALSVRLDVPVSANITQVTVEYDYTKGTFIDATTSYVMGTEPPQVALDFTQASGQASGAGLIENSEIDVTTDQNIYVFLRSSVRATSQTPNGDTTLKRVTLRGTGTNPFGSDDC